VHRRRSSEGTILFATRPEYQTSQSESTDQLLARIRQRCPCCPTPLLLCLSPIVARCERNSSTNRNGAQSPHRTRIGSRRLQYAGSPKESNDAAPSHRTIAASGEFDVMAHQIPAHGTPRMPQRIPPSEKEMQDPRAHDR
jgi:hypothetical protein